MKEPYQFLQGLHQLGQAALQNMQSTSIYGKEWTGILCRLGQQEILVGMSDIHRIIPLTKATRLPGAKLWLAGLVSLQGQLLPVIDLEIFLAGGHVDTLWDDKLDQQKKILIAKVNGVEAGFIVTQVIGMKHYWENERQSSSVHLKKCLGNWCAKQYGDSKNPKPVLDLVALMSSEEFAAVA